MAVAALGAVGQRHELVRVASENHFESLFLELLLQAPGNVDHDDLLARAAPAERARVLTAMSGVKHDPQLQMVGQNVESLRRRLLEAEVQSCPGTAVERHPLQDAGRRQGEHGDLRPEPGVSPGADEQPEFKARLRIPEARELLPRAALAAEGEHDCVALACGFQALQFRHLCAGKHLGQRHHRQVESVAVDHRCGGQLDATAVAHCVDAVGTEYVLWSRPRRITGQ